MFALFYTIALAYGSLQCSALFNDVRDRFTHAALTLTERSDRVLQPQNN
jgi:hypothetical protein